MRNSRDEYDKDDGRLLNGYDYFHQAWVTDGRYVRCAHTSACECYGTAHAGEPIAPISDAEWAAYYRAKGDRNA